MIEEISEWEGIKEMENIKGGGLKENIKRVMKKGMDEEIDIKEIEVKKVL